MLCAHIRCQPYVDLVRVCSSLHALLVILCGLILNVYMHTATRMAPRLDYTCSYAGAWPLYDNTTLTNAKMTSPCALRHMLASASWKQCRLGSHALQTTQQALLRHYQRKLNQHFELTHKKILKYHKYNVLGFLFLCQYGKASGFRQQQPIPK